jgi:nicotinamide mononucleotide (NMN) deamidase PncC
VARPSTLDFGSSSTALTLRVAASGTAGSNEAVLGMVSDSPAISAEPLVVDAQGRGDWRVRVDRSRVPTTTASYFPQLTVQLSPTRSVQVQLAFTVVAADAATQGGDVGPVYVLVIDPDSNRQREVEAIFANGRYSWRLNGYTGTRAIIVAGTDLDADNLLCQPAEVCGGFPVLGTDESMTVPISRTRLDLDFGLMPRTDVSASRLGRPAPRATP